MVMEKEHYLSTLAGKMEYMYLVEYFQFLRFQLDQLYPDQREDFN